MAIFSWEIDELCMSISSHHVPSIQHRGDLTKDRPEALAQIIHDLDPSRQARILVLGAPPCPDFSRIRSNPPGRDGSEGLKFDQMCEFCRALEELLCTWPPSWYLVEKCGSFVKG